MVRDLGPGQKRFSNIYNNLHQVIRYLIEIE
jgi:hypothetical protein